MGDDDPEGVTDGFDITMFPPSAEGTEPMDDLAGRFDQAKDAYAALIAADFPDFDLDEYVAEKAREAEQSDSEAAEASPSLGERIVATLDLSGDGKLDMDDVVRLPGAAVSGASSAARWVMGSVGRAVASFDPAKAISDAQSAVVQAGQAVADSVSGAAASFDPAAVVSRGKDAAMQVGQAIADTDVAQLAGTAAKIGKTAVGIQGIEDRGAARNIQEICQEYYDAAEAVTEQKRVDLNYVITSFGQYRLRSLHETVGRFLKILKDLKQSNAVKEYEILVGSEIDTKTLEKMERLDMAASEALRTTAITGTVSAAAMFGTAAGVPAAVAALATASTGTAISTLSGAAATNAVLAWLGGGSLAAGGGGMAAGAATLMALTAGATAVVAVLSAGIMVSMHYGRKLTEAKEYEKAVGVAVAGLEKAWIVMDAISRRAEELRDVTEELRWRTSGMLDQLQPLVATFDATDTDQVMVFNKCGVLVKTMVELAQTPLLDDDGNLSAESMTISGKVRRVLNTEV